MNTIYQNFANNTSLTTSSINPLPQKLETPIHYTYVNYDEEELEDFNEEDENGNSSIIFSSIQGREDIVRSLVDQGAFVNHQNYNGETALYWAASQGHENIVDLLIENGANLNICNLDGVTPIHSASANGHCNIIGKLFKNGAFVNAQDEDKDTPIHYAVREGKQDAVEFLIRKCNARNDIKNDDNETPLELAVCLEPSGTGPYSAIIKILTSSSNSCSYSNHYDMDSDLNMKKMNLDSRSQFGKFNQFQTNNQPIIF